MSLPGCLPSARVRAIPWLPAASAIPLVQTELAQDPRRARETAMQRGDRHALPDSLTQDDYRSHRVHTPGLLTKG